MSNRLKEAPDYALLYMKRKDRLSLYKQNVLSDKSKKALGFPLAIYSNWEASWTLDDEHLGILDPRFAPEPLKEEAEGD